MRQSDVVSDVVPNTWYYWQTRHWLYTRTWSVKTFTDASDSSFVTTDQALAIVVLYSQNVYWCEYVKKQMDHTRRSFVNSVKPYSTYVDTKKAVILYRFHQKLWCVDTIGDSSFVTYVCNESVPLQIMKLLKSQDVCTHTTGFKIFWGTVPCGAAKCRLISLLSSCCEPRLFKISNIIVCRSRRRNFQMKSLCLPQPGGGRCFC